MSLQALIVTCDPAVKKVVGEVFKLATIEPRFAVTSEQALAQMTDGKFDSVVVDCDGLSNGIQALESLRKGKLNRTVIAFALLTANETVKPAYQAGANF